MKKLINIALMLILSFAVQGCGYIPIPLTDNNNNLNNQKTQGKQKKQQKIEKIRFGDYNQSEKFNNQHNTFSTSDKIGFIFYTPNDVQMGVTTLKFDILDKKTDIIVHSVNRSVSPEWRGMQGNLFKNYNNLPSGDYQLNVSYPEGKLIAQGKFYISDHD